jgi:hypothetical protein
MAAGPPGASTRAAGGAQRGRGLPAPGLSVAELAVLRHEVGNALTCASGRAQLLMRRIPPWAADADREALDRPTLALGRGRVRRERLGPRTDRDVEVPHELAA